MNVADMGIFAGSSSLYYGSARSMGLAGAMTSLGGDASSMSINPAGLGMAQESSLSITPMVSMPRGETASSSSSPYDNSVNSFAMSNLSTIINLYESGTTRLVSLNLGLGYNRVADFNYGYSLSSLGSSSSISQLFSRQLTSSGVGLDELIGENNPNWSALSTNLWSAALGYKTGLTFQSHGEIPSGYYDTSSSASSASNYRDPIVESDAPIWSSTWLSPDATVNQYMAVESSGSIGEYDIALGANVDNKLYLGFTLAINSLYQRLDLLYGEEYENNTSDGSSTEYYRLNSSGYNQAIITSGSGVGVKVGATYRPTTSLRVGVAYHSPTWYSLNRSYQASLASSSNYYNGSYSQLSYITVDSPVIEDYNSNKWKFRTASKLLVGGSYTFGMRGLISADYERAWYGSMSMTDTPSGVSQELYSGISEIYQSVNTLRLGAEIKLSPIFALRGGYSLSSSMVSDGVSSADLLDIPTLDKVSYYSAGVGYSPNRGVRIDLTYMRQRSDYTSYTLFYSSDTMASVGDGEYDSSIPSASSAQSGSFTTRLKQSNIALSMTFYM